MSDGINWPEGLGEPIPDQIGGPYILSLTNGDLFVTSNLGNISISENFGQTWHLTERAWQHKKNFEEDWTQTIWSSLYQTGPKEIAIMSTVQREQGGHQILLRFGEIKSSSIEKEQK